MYNILAVDGVPNAFKIEEKITLKVVQADIFACTDSALVITNNANLTDTQGLAQNLVMRGGSSVQEGCYAWMNAFGESLADGKIPFGGCAVTSAGTLTPKFVIHTRGPNYSDIPDED